MRAQLLILALFSISLVGCATWQDAGEKVLTTTQPILHTVETRFMVYAEEIITACPSEEECPIEALKAAALSIDIAYDTWWLAYTALKADDQASFLGSVACLVDAFEVMVGTLRDLGITALEGKLEAAIAVGRSLLVEYGGVTCVST